MKRWLLILLILCLVVLAGCQPIIVGGPFVTNIGYDGEGNLVITSNTIFYDPVWCNFSNGANPQTIVIKSPKR